MLNKNGNTVKKTILALNINDEKDQKLIKACYKLESSKEEPRKSIINTIKNKIKELNNDEE